MSARTDQPSTAQNLARSNESLSQNFSAQDDVANPAMTCPRQGPQKRHYHVGLRMRIEQYNIDGRKMSLGLPMKSLESLKASDGKVAELFHKLDGSELPLAARCEEPRMPKNLYPIGSDVEAPDAFEGDLICATKLTYETGTDYYQKGDKQGDLNEFLGRDIGLHLSRTKTFRVDCTGNYDHSKLIRVGPLAKTEMMCCRVFAYLKTNIGGTDTYYEIKDGVISGKTLSYTQYRDRALIKADNNHHDAEGEDMPFIPGVYQFHVLLESAAEGSFALTEIYCDGDCIYPE
jgi:hypothetical protein